MTASSPKYLVISTGATMASAMNSTPGAATWQQSFINCRIRCASRSFWQVRADLLPQERHRVQAHDVGALVGPEQDDVDHLDEDGRVAIVEIPLVVVEHRHHPFPHVLVPGEVPGGGLGEDLRHGLLEHVGHVAVVEDVVVVLIFDFSAPGPLRPLVLVRCVIGDHVERQEHAARVHGLGKLAKVFQSADGGIDLAEVADRIAAVARRPRGIAASA